MAPFHGWGSTAPRLQPLRGGSLLSLFLCVFIYVCVSFYVRLYQYMQVKINVYKKSLEQVFVFLRFRLLPLGLLFGQYTSIQYCNSILLQPLRKTFKSTQVNKMDSLLMLYHSSNPSLFKKGGLTSSNLATRVGMKKIFQKGMGLTKGGIVQKGGIFCFDTKFLLKRQKYLQCFTVFLNFQVLFILK